MAPNGTVANPQKLEQALDKYAEVITPWAESVATYMVADADRRNVKGWMEASAEIGRNLRREITSAPTGHVLRQLLDENVDLITSLPRDAAKRVHKLTLEAAVSGERAREIAKEILRSGEVTASRANLIARTEVARTASLLTESRARYTGSEGYIWRTAGDFDVRDSHAEMEGRYVRWDTKPRLSDGTVTHAGQIYNCRCYPEPVIPET